MERVLKTFFVLLLILGVLFFTATVVENETPQRTWGRIVDWYDKLAGTRPSPISAPVPALASAPKPAPVVKPPPIPTPTPVAPPDPLAWLLEHKDQWPKQVTLLKTTELPVIYNGRVAGSISIPGGNSLKVISIERGKVNALVGETQHSVPIEATDLPQIAEDEMDKPVPSPTIVVSAPTATLPPPKLAPTADPAASPFGATRGFVHPGGLHTQADLDRMRDQVAARAHPWIDGWNRLITDSKAQNTYRAHAQEHMESRQVAQNDATSAYLNAIRWYISGDTSYAECAVRNLNSWSATVNHVPYGPDQPGLGGIPIGTFALAAEVLRIYPGWKQEDQDVFKHMLLTYFYPACNDFLVHQTGDRFWANWHTCNILAVMAIGVFCDDQKIFDQGVDDFKNGSATGSIMNAVNNLYPGGLGQWQESGRDQAHALGGQGLLAEACQVAWNQNLDLFGYAHNRLLAGAEYNAQYTQWKGVPYTYYNNGDNAKQFYISAAYHGRLGNCQYFELLYNHYVVLKGLAAPNVKRFAELLRPEGGNADILGYGTLTYTLKAEASPYPASPIPPVPSDLIATAGLGRVELKWSPSGAYSTQGYNVLRATTSGGPYESVFSTVTNTSPRYTDTKVTDGTTYYYVVSAINQAGTSANSAEASAKPTAAEALPQGWAEGDVGSPGPGGSAAYASAANHSFIVTGGGIIGGAKDDCHFVYQSVTGDFTITARLTDMSGRVDKVGLMMRESLRDDAMASALTLGEFGGREARSRTRAETGANMFMRLGCDYTRTPVWFRSQRSGNSFTAWQSQDGITWFRVGMREFSMAPNYLVGLVATSGQNTGEPATATFDNVITDVTPPQPPAAPSKLAAISSNSGTINLTWTNKATNQIGFKIECSSDNVNFYEIADLGPEATSFANTGLKPSATYSYRVRAYNIGGYSAYSNTASITLVAPFGVDSATN